MTTKKSKKKAKRPVKRPARKRRTVKHVIRHVMRRFLGKKTPPKPSSGPSAAPLTDVQVQKFREILTQKRDDLLAIVQRKKEQEIQEVEKIINAAR